ncbi:hypothetical protein ACFQ5D_07850 [Paenibacillus farraposensis]|uniref:Uncharacterized protein n=1 Tax=Paenibacillus farraposensis TaxID=2807095 RepID=A0ABW4DB95_9BACL|nr:hypothetical protein [Paenibacillus farraposensis]MCC3380316.1 hypothetical protein [Paenibacillus farraposensis]
MTVFLAGWSERTVVEHQGRGKHAEMLHGAMAEINGRQIAGIVQSGA